MVFRLKRKRHIADHRVLNTVKNAMTVKPKEEVFILHTESKNKIAKIFSNSCKEAGANVSSCLIEQKNITNREPAKPVAEAMKNSDIVLCITDFSLTHTRAVTNALKSGCRIASMPGFSEEMLPALDIDYNELGKMCKRVESIFNKAHKITIKTELGTNLSLNCKKRKPQIDDGLLDRKGTLHNIPAGECAVAPVENSANGIIIIDQCMSGIKKINNPICITMKNGRIQKIEGHSEMHELKDILLKSDKNARTLCEFSIGLNKKANLIGEVLNDEKSLGTCHVAFGDNINLGGKNRSNVHLDGIINKPTVICGDDMIMNCGVFRWRW